MSGNGYPALRREFEYKKAELRRKAMLRDSIAIRIEQMVAHHNSLVKEIEATSDRLESVSRKLGCEVPRIRVPPSAVVVDEEIS